MPSEKRTVNPATAALKASKLKSIKKSKIELAARRNEKLAHRNPERLQRQIDDLKALEQSGELKAREKTILEGLEKDVRAIRKAREFVGDKGGRRDGKGDVGGHGGGVLGKRSHDGQARRPPRTSQLHSGANNTPLRGNRLGSQQDSGSETDESVRNIPMPRDTPPPAPRFQNNRHSQRSSEQSHINNYNGAPHNPESSAIPGQPHALPSKPAIRSQPSAPQTTYSSAPQLRDLKREAVSRFVPDIVRKNQALVSGSGGSRGGATGGVGGRLPEPEEMDRLEKSGYYLDGRRKGGAGGGRAVEEEHEERGRDMVEETDRNRIMEEEEERLMRELDVEMEMETGRDSGIGERIGEGSGQRNGAAISNARRMQVEMEEVDDEDM